MTTVLTFRGSVGTLEVETDFCRLNSHNPVPHRTAWSEKVLVKTAEGYRKAVKEEWEEVSSLLHSGKHKLQFLRLWEE